MSFQPTNTPHWRSEDGQLLQNLREKAGLDELVFARTNTVSLAQLRELERGGESSFYNPQIKRSTGRKLLRKLGHEFPETAPPEPSQVLAAAAHPQSPPHHPAAISLTPVREAQVNATAPTAMTPEVMAQPHGPRARSRSSMLWILGLCTLTLLVVWGTRWTEANSTWPSSLASPTSASALPDLSPRQPTPPADRPLALATTAPQTADAATASPLVASRPTTAAPEPTPMPRASTTAPVACDWQHRDTSTVFRQSDPLKPGNYVHFVAQADTTLCVLDQDNKLTTLNLPAGAAKSVYGVAPFLMQSNGWQNLVVFFQGRRVHAARDGVQHIQLQSQSF